MFAFPRLLIGALHFHGAQSTWVPLPCKEKIDSLATGIELKLHFAVHEKALKKAEDSGWGGRRRSGKAVGRKIRKVRRGVEKLEKAVEQKIRALTSAASDALHHDLGIRIRVEKIVFPRTDPSREKFLRQNSDWKCPLASSKGKSAVWGDLTKIHDWAAATTGRKSPGMWVYVATTTCGSNKAGSWGGLGHRQNARASNTILFTSLFVSTQGAWQRLLHEVGHHMVGKHTFDKYRGIKQSEPLGLMQYSWVRYEGHLGRLLHSLHQKWGVQRP